MLPKGILFDLDDTIIARDTVEHPTWDQMCTLYAPQVPGLDADRLFQAIQDVRTWFWSDAQRYKYGRQHLQEARRAIVQRAFLQLGINDVPLAYEMADAYATARDALVTYFPRAEDTLRALRAQHVSLALLTNGGSKLQRQKIARFGLERFFQVILIEGELGYGKPEEAVYQQAIYALGLTPDTVWSVGDHLEWDVATPQRLGIFSLWHDVRKQGLPTASRVVPDRIITSIAELVAA